MSINVLITFNVRPESLASFSDLMKTVKVGLPTVPGCQSVKIFNQANNPLNFSLVETWDSMESHSRHVQGLQDSGQWSAIAEQLSCDPLSAYYNEI